MCGTIQMLPQATRTKTTGTRTQLIPSKSSSNKEASYPRESRDTPSEKAFCAVASGVRLSDFAILLQASFDEQGSLVREHHLWSIRVVLLSLPYLPAPMFLGAAS
jgi:hypothetical protein